MHVRMNTRLDRLLSMLGFGVKEKIEDCMFN
jgi:hypothetical protein